MKYFVLLFLFVLLNAGFVSYALQKCEISFSSAYLIAEKESLAVNFNCADFSEEFRVKVLSNVGVAEIYNENTKQWVSYGQLWSQAPVMRSNMLVRFYGVSEKDISFWFEFKNAVTGVTSKTVENNIFISNFEKTYVEKINLQLENWLNNKNDSDNSFTETESIPESTVSTTASTTFCSRQLLGIRSVRIGIAASVVMFFSFVLSQVLKYYGEKYISFLASNGSYGRYISGFFRAWKHDSSSGP